MTSLRPHPDLEPLLVKHGLSWEAFSKKGRPPKGVRSRRATIVTELHQTGTSWQKMLEVTGLSLMGIQRLTEAVGCEAACRNRAINAAKVGASLRGRAKPWLSAKLERDWAEGLFDFHRGRQRSEDEKEKLREASRRPEVKARRSASAKRRWRNPKHRQALLGYHRSPENRHRMSELQSRRMLEDPVKWTKGRGAYVETCKCAKGRIWTRSSHERAAVARVEGDPHVVSFEFEPRFNVAAGRRWILPDLLLHTLKGKILVEVKAAWVLTLPPEHKVQQRLKLAEDLARSRGWQFAVWTEKDLGEWLTAEKN